MAVVMYTGTPGSGKSYHAAEVVDRALRRKIPVIANFQVNLNPKKHKGEFVYIPTLEMTVDKFKQYAQEHFDSSKHRHYFYDIILITQNDRMIDRQIRSLVETEYKHRKLTNYGAKGMFMIVVFHKMFVAVQYWYPIQERVGSEFFNLRKSVCRLYDTFKKFDKPKEEKSQELTDMKARIAAFNAKGKSE